MRGDILLYVHDGSLTSRLIAALTGGRFSHVAVQLDDSTSIEATDTKGVHKQDIQFPNREIVTVSVRDAGAKDEDIEAGIAFLESMLGSRYSYLDCLDALPPVKALGVELVIRGHFDCSHLAAEYLKHVDCKITDALYPDTNGTAAVSPNDIARAAGVK